MSLRQSGRSDYMYWAKQQQPVRFALSSSEVPHFRLDQLSFGLADLELAGASHPRYGPLIEAIAAHAGVAANQVATADGTSMANFLALSALVEPGDEVMFERPGYEPLLAAIRFLGGSIRFFDRPEDDGFQIDVGALEALLTQRTRLVVLTNLHNPSGALTSVPELEAIGRLAANVGAHVLVDEVYLDAASTPQVTAARLGPQFVTTNSLTKVYGLSGLRCGWVIADEALIDRMWRLNDLFVVNRAHQAERLACIAFDHLVRIASGTAERLQSNRSLFNSFVAGRPDIDCMPAEHGITVFPRWHGGDTAALDALLRSRFDTSVVPGHWFDCPDRFRIGLGGDTDDLREGLSRIGAGLDELA